MFGTPSRVTGAGRALALTAVLATLGLAGCADDPADDATHRVVTAFYPLQFVTEQVLGDDAPMAVDTLVQPGTEPHDVELTPRQVARIAEADLVVYLRDFQPAVDDAVADVGGDRALDVTTVAPLTQGFVPLEDGVAHEDEKGTDPHVWLDPTRLAGIADAVATRLGTVDPDHADAFTANAAALRGKLATLDTEYRTALARCAQKNIVVSHNAFGYLAARYGLTQVPITGLTPETEPSPARLAEVARYARRNGVTVIFFETLVSPRVARTLAREVGARAAVLDPIEGLAPDSEEDYFSVMRSNLTALRGALRCA